MENLSKTQQRIQVASTKTKYTTFSQFESLNQQPIAPPIYQRQRDGLCKPQDSNVDPTNNRRLFDHHDNDRMYNGYKLIPVKHEKNQLVNIDRWDQPSYTQRKHSPPVGQAFVRKVTPRPISEFSMTKQDVYGVGGGLSQRENGKKYFNVQDNLHGCIQQTEITQFIRSTPTNFKTKRFW
ncbi:hypothetical protein SS50377_24517 [Spironucleus salmonicida]|uniref:Uncharacterized protein n=1 Tax=Spironucleus salmonicida TaxID=348837 RepID=V6LMT5_9EUKA|nr:hypothetical protein SS50377_24517 [Spironucleus salmonicida]|eukprot:EST45940.1 Hypothetical protein SS50377_13919 [Spironucleus salmonicida]